MKRLGGWIVMSSLTVLLTWCFLAGLTKTMEHTMADVGTQGERQLVIATADMPPGVNHEPQPSVKNPIKHQAPAPEERPLALDTASPTESIPSPTIAAIRTAYQRTGASVQSHDLPPIRSEAESVEEYLAFSKAAGFRFVLFSEDRTSVAEVLFEGERPAVNLKPSIDFKRYAKQGRLINHPTLVQTARTLAADHGFPDGTTLYALVPTAYDDYVRGKLMTILSDERISPESVRWVEVKLCIKKALPDLPRPTMNVLRVIHKGGESIPRDPEM